jgi:hypothetical protein
MALPLFQETKIADGAHLIFLKPFSELSYKKIHEPYDNKAAHFSIASDFN